MSRAVVAFVILLAVNAWSAYFLWNVMHSPVLWEAKIVFGLIDAGLLVLLIRAGLRLRGSFAARFAGPS